MDKAGIEALTRRQKEILRLVSQQYQTKEIARKLNISERTVKTHTEEIRRRLGVSTSRDAARLLAAYETTALGRDDRGTARPIGENLAMGVVQPHEQTKFSPTLLSDDTVERPRNGSAGIVDNSETRLGSGNSGRNPEAIPNPGIESGLVRTDRGDRLVDRRWESFEEKLARLNAFQWLGLIVIVGVLSSILVSGLIAAVIGTLEGLQVLNRQIG